MRPAGLERRMGTCDDLQHMRESGQGRLPAADPAGPSYQTQDGRLRTHARARPCDFRWIQEVRRECIRCGVPFVFKQTGAVFIKDGKTFHIARKDQLSQARKSGYSYSPGEGLADTIHYLLPERNLLFEALARSDFRRRFHLSVSDKEYIYEKGFETIRSHAQDFVAKRLSSENPENDGEQTPMKGHPVFVAQHATACCCRACLEKWHHIPAGKILTATEQQYVVDVLMDWIRRDIS